MTVPSPRSIWRYAAHLPGRPNNIETALAEALYLTSVERNADVVEMTCVRPVAGEGRPYAVESRLDLFQ